MTGLSLLSSVYERISGVDTTEDGYLVQFVLSNEFQLLVVTALWCVGGVLATTLRTENDANYKSISIIFLQSKK